MDRRHSIDEKKYAILSTESIRYIAEAAGYSDISTDVLSILSEDVIYRLREAAHVILILLAMSAYVTYH